MIVMFGQSKIGQFLIEKIKISYSTENLSEQEIQIQLIKQTPLLKHEIEKH